MVEGSLDLYWENNDDLKSAKRYRVAFLPYKGHSPTQPKYVVGERNLHQYLADLHDPSIVPKRRHERARQWMMELHSKTSLSLPNMMLADEQAKEFLNRP